MKSLEATEVLIAEELPIPFTRCDACGKTIYRLNKYFRCPSCGALSTEHGGVFIHHGPADQDWIDSCAKADARLAELKKQ